MSDYCRNLVVRYPIEKKDREQIESILDAKQIGHQHKDGYFEVCCTEDKDYNYRYFLDYVIHSTYGEEAGEFRKIRTLYPVEIESFEPLFKTLIPEVDMLKARVVDYCWYNCCEPPTYYDEIDDDLFYRPLAAPQSFWKQGVNE